MTLDQFLSIWKPEDLPFCPVGMGILHRLFEKDDTVVIYLPDIQLLERGLPFEGDPLWQALLHHTDYCDDCKHCMRNRAADL